MNLLFLGRSDEGIAAYRRAAELSPASRSSRHNLVWALARAGRWVEARAECRRALDLNPASILPLLRLTTGLSEHGREEEVIVICRQALEQALKIDQQIEVYAPLGFALMQTDRHDEALKIYSKMVELAPGNAAARRFFAHELAAAGRRAEAIVQLETVLAGARPYPPYVIWYAELGTLLRSQNQTQKAATVFRKAANLDPGYTPAWNGLAAALLDQGRFADARAATQRLLTLPANEVTRRAQRRQLELCDTLLSVDADLPEILAGKKRPAKVSTQRALAQWCLKHRRLAAAALGFYDSVLRAQPSLADDMEAGNRFHAACAAVLVGCGAARDAGRMDDQRRAELRKQALDWLTAEHNAWAARHLRGKPGDRTVVATAVRSWQQNKDLAGVCDEQALARLPREERRAWQTLWANVRALAARDPVALFDRARTHIARRQWKKAAECFAQGFKLEPATDGDSCFEYAVTQLLSRDRPSYRRTCAHMLARCQMAPPMRPYLAARACTLAPDSANDPARPANLSRNELQQSGTEFWSLTEQAALQVRAGRPRDAIPLLERSLTADGRPGRAVLNWLWLALAYQKLGKAEEARRWLDRAAGWLDQQGDRMPLDTGFTGLHRHNWLEAHVLLEEAKRLLR
jgi:tetratricopeptide (TPR) repeat protein